VPMRRNLSDDELEQLFRDPYRLYRLRKEYPSIFEFWERVALSKGFITALTQSGSPEARFRN
jgi:hypothetical protein